MALWNPFNLFKKKAAETQEPAPESASPPTADPAPAPAVEPAPAPAAAQPNVPPAETPAEPQIETEPKAAPAPEATPVTAAAKPVSKPPVENPATKPTEPEQPKPAEQPESAEQPKPPISMTQPEPAASQGSVAEPTPADDVAAVPAQPAAEPDQPASDTAATPTVSAADATSPDVAGQPPADQRHLPFDQQTAPSQPVDFYDRISQKPTVERKGRAAKEDATPGLTGWFRSAVSKTARVLNTDIRDLVGREGRLVDDAFLKELFTHLIKTDMGVGPASEIRDAIGKKYRARKVHLAQLIEEAKTTIAEIMKQEEVRLQLADQGTSVVMVVGVNGSGKTTSIAKLASMFRQDGKSVVLGAGDTFRAAAVEQLRQWAGRIGAEIVTGKDQSDPASVAFRAAQFAKDNQFDICIIDTAGRLQTQSHLMQELAKIRRVLDKVIPGAPHETLLVLDSTAGQNAISQARGFSDAANCSGIVLAKLDGTAKGGVAIPIRKEFGLPVKFIGFGETADAIAPFDVDRYVDALFNFDA